MKKRIDLNKIVGYAILIFVFSTFILGALYDYFCTERIAVRERHLVAVSQAIAPPESAVYVRDQLFGKWISRTYSITYQCKEPREALMNHYRAQFEAQGYVWKQKGNELITQKDGVILTIHFVRNEIQVYIEFDDIFQKLSI